MAHTRKESTQKGDDGKVELRVAAGSQAPKVAGAIVKYMQEGYEVTLNGMGAGAVNQAVKAIAIARGMAAPQGWDLYCVPGFVDEIVDGMKKTAMIFRILK